MPLESLIDGPPQTDKCDRETPSGPAWVVIPPNGHIEAAFVRFSMAQDPSRTIDVFNVHPTAGTSASLAARRINQLFYQVAPSLRDGPYLYYPPLMVGDFNELASEVSRYFPLFENVFFVEGPPDQPDPVGGLIGRDDMFRSQCRPRALLPALTVPPTSPDGFCWLRADTLVGDHCGFFIPFELDGPEPEACRLRRVLIDTPQAEGFPSHASPGRNYRLTAAPVGGGPVVEYHWEPGGATTAHLDARAGEPFTEQTWTVTARDAGTGDAVSGSVTVQVLDSACFQACRAAREFCVNCEGEPGECPLKSQCKLGYNQCATECLLQ
jgi:hypothetical protein